MNYYVYAYKTPIEIHVNSMELTIPADEYFYVGKGKEKRKYDHLNEKPDKICNYLKHGVIQKLYNQGYTPIIEVLIESEDETYILEKEIEYIAKFGRLTQNKGFLTNLTNGGQGTSGHKHTDETKKHWSKIRKGRPPANKGTKRPGVGGRPKGIKWSEETREKMMTIRSQEGYYDYLKSPERNKKISEAKKGCKGSAQGKTWYNNGQVETYQFECPANFVKGRLKRNTNGKKGLLWYTNGIESKQFKENCQPEGWNRGRIIKKR